MKMLITLVFGLSAAVLSALDVVRNGVPCAEIILDQTAPKWVRHAAKDLQQHLKKISGAELTIVNAPSGKMKNRIFVGESRFTKALGYKLPVFKNSGYDILIKKDYAILAGPMMIYPPLKYNPRNKKDREKYHKFMGEKYGMHCFDHGGGRLCRQLGNVYANDDVGPFHAVSAFLESLGVRFYAPYEDGTVIPKSKNIILSPRRETKEAAYSRRDWFHSGEDPEGQLWLKRLKNGVRNGIVFNHTSRNLLSHPEQWKKHPDWFAEESPGKTYAGAMRQGGIPRYNDPGFQAAMAEWAGKLLDTYPTLTAVTCGSPDGQHLWDWRDRKKYLLPGVDSKQAHANLMWDFHVPIAKKLKKTHPAAKLLWWCQYNSHVPTNVDPSDIPDNIIFPPRGITPSYLVSSSYFKSMTQVPLDYIKTFKKIGKGPGWEWWLSYRSPSAPRYPVFYPHTLQKYRKFMVPYSDGIFAEVPSRWHSAGDRKSKNRFRLGEAKLMAPMMYINSKLLWDPDLDMKALLEEYYRLYFGPASAEMKRFYEFAEKVWARPASRSVTENSGFLKPADVPEYFRLLANAKKKTAMKSVYRRRIEYLEKGYAPLKKLFPSLKRKGPIHRIQLPMQFPTEPQVKLDNCKIWLPMFDNATAAPVKKNKTEVCLTLSSDRKHFRVIARCWESNMKELVAKCTKKDDSSIFNDDLVEIYIDTPERNYFKICVNPAGTIWDESTDTAIVSRDTLPILWNPGTKAAVKKYSDRWEVEVIIPTADFGKTGPTRQYPWGVNVCRTRIAGRDFGRQQNFSIAPTGASYKLQKYWARIWSR